MSLCCFRRKKDKEACKIENDIAINSTQNKIPPLNLDNLEFQEIVEKYDDVPMEITYRSTDLSRSTRLPNSIKLHKSSNRLPNTSSRRLPKCSNLSKSSKISRRELYPYSNSSRSLSPRSISSGASGDGIYVLIPTFEDESIETQYDHLPIELMSSKKSKSLNSSSHILKRPRKLRKISDSDTIPLKTKNRTFSRKSRSYHVSPRDHSLSSSR